MGSLCTRLKSKRSRVGWYREILWSPQELDSFPVNCEKGTMWRPERTVSLLTLPKASLQCSASVDVGVKIHLGVKGCFLHSSVTVLSRLLSSSGKEDPRTNAHDISTDSEEFSVLQRVVSVS